ncbi:Thiol-disulfide oxidoreductase ResA [Dyadobacter sp. CECT 9275]|uniref:Thiol-disulfide oxidoreductase ResA n=1 Tax=Dyadobacter helix TaxID=2822344 RepID=A0A916JC24_9BACT|nr:TlpA disulfide reductase family protein [Dyadobacter sp. CECT 9275]CAG5003236.1 Thiol-disulfide oxidoreductase ResA [Dyadobacter sp. CECT 9275]
MKTVFLILIQLLALHAIAHNTFAYHLLQSGGCAENNGMILAGKLDNFSGRSVKLWLTSASGEDLLYNISVSNGEFSIPDSLVSFPGIALLAVPGGDEDLPIPLLLAPDYSLSLRMDVQSAGGMRKPLVFSGKGAAANNFYTRMIHYRQKNRPSGNYNFDEWYQKIRKGTDSLYHIYNQIYRDSDDTHYGYFSRLVYNDMAFDRLDILIQRAHSMLDYLSAAEVNRYVTANFDEHMLKNISDPQYLASPAYRNLMGFSFSYLFYLVKYDEKLSADTSKGRYEINLDKINSVFKDDCKDYVLYKFVNLNLVASVNSYEKFRERTQVTMVYLNDFKNKRLYETLRRAILTKESELAGLKKNDPAPMFSLADPTGKKYDLNHFRNKIVLLDFWASWCGPCRQQTPFLESLHSKYKTDDRISFVSIAVRDKKSVWLRALEKDKPGWLQLFDADGKTAANYFTNAIPKFVIIDGKGKIFDFQAPSPDDGDKLERLIESCLKN